MPIVVIILVVLMSSVGAIVSKRTMELRGEPVLEVRSVQGTATRSSAVRSDLDALTFDSIPVFTDKDIEYYRYSDGGAKPSHIVEFMRYRQKELRRRVSDLYYHSCVVFVHNKPVYSGVFLPEVPGGYPPSHTYVGPYIRLPGEHVGDERLTQVFIGFESDGEIWSESDDPRGDSVVIAAFRAENKLRPY